MNLKNWQAITLLETIYKGLAKTMAQQIQLLLDELLKPHQIGFLKGRSIIDNIFLAFKSMEWVLESSHSIFMLLLDFEKAYNQVEWGFLEGTMVAIGFFSIWIQ